MNTHNLIKHSYLLSALLVMFAGACSNDDDVMPQLKATTYENGSLSITYNGEEMPGKYARFTPASDNIHATLTLGGSMNLENLPGVKFKGTVATTGVLPGDAVYNMPVTLSEGKGCYTFTGAGSTKYLKYTCSGKITDNKLELNIDNVALLDQAFAGIILKPAPSERNADLVSFKSSPFYVKWDVAPIPELSSLQIPLSDLLQLALNAPVVPVYANTAYASVAQLYGQAVQSLAFRGDGNLVIKYMSSANGALQQMTANGNTLQYLPVSADSYKLYVNPLSVMGLYLTNRDNGYSGPQTITWTRVKQESAATGSSAAGGTSDMQAVTAKLLAIMLPSLADGIPMRFEKSAAGYSMYVNPEYSAKILKDIIIPMLEEEQTQALIKELVTSNATLSHYSSQIETALGLLPVIVQHTTDFRLGLQFVSQ